MRSSSPNNSAILCTRSRSSLEIWSREESFPAILATVALRRKRTICRAKWVGLWPSAIRWSTCRKTSSLGAARDRLHNFFKYMGRCGTDQIAYSIGGELSAARSNSLVEDGECIAHRSIAGLGKQSKRIVIGFDRFAA